MGLNDREYMRDHTPVKKKKATKALFLARLRFFLWRIWRRK